MDTNIMLRLLEPGHPHCAAALGAIAQLTTKDNETFCCVPHCLYEVYHVLTRVKNGHGKAPAQAVGELMGLLANFPMQADLNSVFNTWVGLVAKYNITGRLAYDAKIPAAMIDHGIRSLLTFNDADFKRFTEITVLNPFDVIGRARV